MRMMKKAAALVLAASLGVSALTGCGSTKLDGTKTLIALGDDTVSLGAGSLYARYQQAQIYKYWGAYFGQGGEIFDMVTNSSTGETYGESLKESAMDDLKKMLAIKQHASEYKVELTEEQKSAIDAAAQAYIDGNGDEVKNMIGASKEDAVTLMELQTIRSLMMDPIVADVDTNIPDDEVQQSSLTYITVNVNDDEDDSTDDEAAAKDTAQKVLDAILALEKVADADLSETASGFEEGLTASTGTFTTNDPEDTYLDASIIEAVKDAKEGEVIDHVIKSEDGDHYYIVRFDKTFDEDATESERNSAIVQRKQDKYNEVTDGWVEEAEFTIDEDAWKSVVINDAAAYTLKDPESTAEEAAEPAAESEAVSAAESAAESEIMSAVESAAESEIVSDVESAAESAAE